MINWLAGISAAAVAWIINRFLVAKGGERAVIWLVPPIEEFLKTGLALLLGAVIPLTHGVFGLLEAIHDYLNSPRWGLWAGLSSIITHFFLGWFTLMLYRLFPSWLVAMVLAAVLHIFWNLLIIRLMAKITRRGGE